jgi:hypothetical protein
MLKHFFPDCILHAGSWDGAVNIETGYGLDDRGVGLRVPVGSKICQTGFGVHVAPYPVGTGGSSAGGKADRA